MPAGRPQIVDPGTLYTFAHVFYWDFRGLVYGGERWRLDKAKYGQLQAQIAVADIELTPEQKRSIEEGLEREIQNGHLESADIDKRRLDIEQGLKEATRDLLLRDAAEEARKTLKI